MRYQWIATRQIGTSLHGIADDGSKSVVLAQVDQDEMGRWRWRAARRYDMPTGGYEYSDFAPCASEEEGREQALAQLRGFLNDLRDTTP